MKKLEFEVWKEKYFEKKGKELFACGIMNIYWWSFTDDGMSPCDKSIWTENDLEYEYKKYLNDDEKSYIGIHEYEENDIVSENPWD